MRVVVAEDSVLFREGLTRLLTEQGHDVVAAVGDARALVAAVAAHDPQLAMVDVRMPVDADSREPQPVGARAVVDLRTAHPGMGLLLLSQHVELRDCLPLIGSPGFGYLLKDRVLDLAEFGDAVVRVASGGTALDPQVVQALVRSRTGPRALDGLSSREREVLGRVAEGHSNTAVAGALGLSERTVEAHMRSIFTKLGLVDDGTTHRRVRAVVAYLDARRAPQG